MNEKYWQKFYKGSGNIHRPSDFAKFSVGRIPMGSVIFDLGAGDGRDSVILSNRGTVIAIEPNTEKPGRFKHPDIEHVQIPAEKLAELSVKPDIIYARWFFHAVDERVEEIVLNYMWEKGAVLMAEFRIEGDEPDDTHDRRIINIYDFVQKLVERGYHINHMAVSRTFSIHGDDKPLLGRVIAEPANS